MPMITIQTGAVLSSEAKREILVGMVDAISAIEGKNADNTMVAVHDGAAMLFGDRAAGECLHMHVLLLGKASLEEKRSAAEKSFLVFEKAAGIKPDGVYITMQELEHWGEFGGYV